MFDLTAKAKEEFFFLYSMRTLRSLRLKIVF